MSFPSACTLGLLLLVASPPLVTAQSSDIRIRLFEREEPSSVQFVVVGGKAQLYLDHSAVPSAILEAGEVLSVRATDGELSLLRETGAMYVLTLRIGIVGATRLEAVRLNGEQISPRRLYSGRIEIRPVDRSPDELLIVNEIDLEQYVAAVVDREYGLSEPEAAKAVAVAVRTFALRNSLRSNEPYDHVDHESSQVFHGVDALDPLSIRAANETAGEVVTYRNQLIEAVHFASSGGHTADNERVWNSSPVPYLRGKNDPYDAAPDAEWTRSFSRERVHSILGAHFNQPVSGFSIESRSPDGRAERIALQGHHSEDRDISSSEFRDVLNRALGTNAIRSTHFTLASAADAYVITGRGHGHGVGLPHWGAHGMAKEGRGYREILAHYYTGTSIATLKPEGAALVANSTIRDASDRESAAKPATSVLFGASNGPDSFLEQILNPSPRIGW